MVTRSRVVTGAAALIVAAAAIGCGALIGIEDGVPDPGTSAGDATTIIDGGTLDTGAKDAATPDTGTTPDAAQTPGPIGKSGGDLTTLPCGGNTCMIPAQSCCSYRSSTQQGLYTGLCATTCAPPGAGTDRLGILKCSGPENCPTTAPRCCYRQGSSSVSTTCETSCSFPDVVLCDPNGGTNTCGSRSCQHFTGATMPPSWGYCQ